MAAGIQSITADVVLQQLNSNFDRSKSEQIHRFLRDQEELNQALSVAGDDVTICDVDEEESSESDTETLYNQRLDLYRVRPQSAMGWHIQQQPEQTLSSSSTHLSDTDPDTGELMCIGDRKPLTVERENSRGVLRKKPKSNTEMHHERDTSHRSQVTSQSTEAALGRLRGNKENQDDRGRDLSLSRRQSSVAEPKPEGATAEGATLTRKGSFRHRVYKVSSGTTTNSGAPSHQSENFAPRPPPQGPAYRNMRPRTTTGIRRARVSENISSQNEAGQESQHAECPTTSIQRLRASAPAGATRDRRIVFESDRGYLKMGNEVTGGHPPLASLQTAGLGATLTHKMEDLSSLAPPPKPRDVNLDDIFSPTKKQVPSYAAHKTGGKAEGVLITNQSTQQNHAPNDYKSFANTNRKYTKTSSYDRSTRLSGSSAELGNHGDTLKPCTQGNTLKASAQGHTLKTSAQGNGLKTSRTPQSSRKLSRGLVDTQTEKHMTLLKLPPLEGRLGSNLDLPLLPPGGESVNSTTEFVARS